MLTIMTKKSNHLSPEQVGKIKEIVLQKKDKAQQFIQFNTEPGNGTDDTAHNYEPLEEGQRTLTLEEKTRDIEKQRGVILECDKVLTLIAKGEYDGICQKTGKPIPFERLVAQPLATKTVEYKNSRPPGVN